MAVASAIRGAEVESIARSGGLIGAVSGCQWLAVASLLARSSRRAMMSSPPCPISPETRHWLDRMYMSRERVEANHGHCKVFHSREKVRNFTNSILARTFITSLSSSRAFSAQLSDTCHQITNVRRLFLGHQYLFQVAGSWLKYGVNGKAIYLEGSTTIEPTLPKHFYILETCKLSMASGNMVRFVYDRVTYWDD